MSYNCSNDTMLKNLFSDDWAFILSLNDDITCGSKENKDDYTMTDEPIVVQDIAKELLMSQEIISIQDKHQDKSGNYVILRSPLVGKIYMFRS
jgi:hypothetical protein